MVREGIGEGAQQYNKRLTNATRKGAGEEQAKEDGDGEIGVDEKRWRKKRREKPHK